ncbi:hypothetical protein U1Q18_051274 [Sarracenia purpurea var. burkii]
MQLPARFLPLPISIGIRSTYCSRRSARPNNYFAMTLTRCISPSTNIEMKPASKRNGKLWNFGSHNTDGVSSNIFNQQVHHDLIRLDAECVRLEIPQSCNGDVTEGTSQRSDIWYEVVILFRVGLEIRILRCNFFLRIVGKYGFECS